MSRFTEDPGNMTKLKRNIYSTSSLIWLRMIWSVKFVYVICKVIGLQEYKIEMKKKHQKFAVLYTIFYVCIYATLSIISLISTMTEENNFILINKYVGAAKYYVMTPFVITVIMFNFLFRMKQVEACRLLSRVDADFARNGVRMEFRQLEQKFNIILTAVVISFITRTFFMLQIIQANVIQSVTLILSMLIKAFFQYKFVMFVLHLQLRFKQINSEIKRFHCKSWINHTNPQIFSDKLYVLCRLHFKLTKIAQKISSAYGVQLLAAIAVSLFVTLYHAYCLYYMLTNGTLEKTSTDLGYPIVWLIDVIGEMYYLVYLCAATSEEANETPIVLHEFRNNRFEIQLENQIQTYSLQMLHHRTKFSVLGFFVIDYTLIYSVSLTFVESKTEKTHMKLWESKTNRVKANKSRKDDDQTYLFPKSVVDPNIPTYAIGYLRIIT